MSLALFLLLFTAGFLIARIAGITFWMEFTFLTISQFVALNPQNPVPSQTIIDANQMLDAFAECFRQGNCRLQLPTVHGALTAMDNAIQQVRDRNMLAGLPFDAPLRVLDLVEHYHATVAAELSGYAGQFRCFLERRVQKQFASMHQFLKRLLNRRAASV
jgi:hypothetical protein